MRPQSRLCALFAVLTPLLGVGSQPAIAEPAIALTTASTAATANAPTAAAPKERSLHFDVFLGDQPIGFQRFDLRTQADELRVETQARFEMSWLKVKTIDYDHRNVENWRGDCLQSIASQTESNGTPSRVQGEAKGPAFEVTTGTGRERLEDCVATFSYWDKSRLLKRSKLLNAQTGEYVDVSVRPLGRGELELGERRIPVERYVLEGEDLAITLAYSLETGEWVALDSPLFGGFTLRYRRRAAELTELRPPPPATDAPAAFDTP